MRQLTGTIRMIQKLCGEIGRLSAKNTKMLKSLIERTAANIVIPDGTTAIGNNAFSDYTGLESVTIPESVASIGHGAFAGCSALESITIPHSVTFMGNAAFNGSGLRSVIIPGSLNSIGDNCFSSNKKLVSAIIQEGVKTLGYSAFAFCSNLKTVYIPASATNIRDSAFFASNNIEEVILGNNFNADGIIFTSDLLTVETMVNMFTALKDRTGDTAYTLTLGSTNLAKLTDEQKAIATNKNWILA